MDSAEKAPAMTENEQVELVFLKFGLAQSDEEFETLIVKFLAFTLGKLSSEDGNVRTKVIQLLTHIKTRLQSRPQVQLPVDKLLDLYSSSNSTFIVNFSIIYIKLGFPRLAKEDQGLLAAKLFDIMEGKAKAHQESIVRLLISAFQYIKLPADPSERGNVFNLEKSPTSKRFLLDFCLDVLLMPYSDLTLDHSRPVSAPPSTTAADSRIPPGLSENGMKRLVGDGGYPAWTVSQIEQYKVGIVNIIGGDIFPENDIITHLVVATSDVKSSVSSVADAELRKRHRSLDWEKQQLSNTLYRLYLGDAAALTPAQKKRRPHASWRKQVDLRVQLKIISNLLRSKVATEQIPHAVQLVHDALFAESSSSKLRSLGQEFIHHMCDKCDATFLNPQAPILLEALIKTTKTFEKEPKSRGLGFTAMGKLSIRVPSIFTKRTQLVHDVFKALSQEPSQEVKLHIQECLAMMSQAYRNVDQELLPAIENIVEVYITDSDHLCRLSAVRYAGKVFSSDHVKSRYFLLLAASDVKEDVASEAKKLLHGNFIDSSESTTSEQPIKDLPTFESMLNFVYKKAQERLCSTKSFEIGVEKIAFLPATFSVLLQYLRKCLLQDACKVIPHGNIVEGEPITEAHVIAEYLKERCSEHSEHRDITITFLSQYLQLIIQYTRVATDHEAVYILLETIATSPKTISFESLIGEQLENKVEWMKGLAYHAKESIRMFGAELHAIILRKTVFDNKQRIEIIEKMDGGPNSKQSYEEKHGTVMILGYLLQSWLSDYSGEAPKVLQTAFIRLLQNAGSPDEAMASAAYYAIGEVARKNRLPLPDDPADGKKDEDEIKDPTNPFYFCRPLKKSFVLSLLQRHIKSSSPHKLREKCVIAIGYLAVGDPGFFQTEKLLNSLLETAEIKEPDLHFTVARALADAALGRKSSAGRNKWRMREDVKESDGADDKVSWILNKILNEYTSHRIPAVRQAASIWLLTLLKTDEISSHPAVKPHLARIQSAFMGLLTEADDLVQDIASKGLGVVYELGSEEQKKELVNALVGSLMEGSATKPDQSNLFHGDKGVGKAPDGSNLSTYKEICALASDLNKPDLVYKFMHLAKHHALWNSKKGAAFGFSNIANLASEQLAPHLPRIVPRLYRYTFDPYTSVRMAMTSIWNSLAPDPKKLIDKYLHEIAIDLTKNLESSLWRTRQSCCLAAAELVRGGRGVQKGEGDIIISVLPEFWYHCLRLMDDIKGSVRDAALIACDSLKKATFRLCDHDQGKQGEKATAAVLRILLKDGLNSRVKDVKSLSLSVLVGVSKKSGKLIRGCVPEMVVALLHALSDFEPAELNYLSVRSDQGSREALDLARASYVKSSPMVETIDRIIQYADKQTLEQLVPSLNEIIKRNYGIMTKAGCSHVVISLVSQCPKEVGEFASTLTSSLSSGLLDNSIAIRKCNAEALGHLAKVAKDSTIVKLLNKLKGWYLDKEDDIHRHASAITCHSIGKHSPNVLRDHASVVLPLAFLGKHEMVDTKDSTNNWKEDKNSARYLWNDLWNEFTPGLSSAIKLYLDELIIFTSAALQSQQWKMKAQAAATMETVATQQREKTITGSKLQKLLEVLTGGLQGRTWDGKNKLLTALSAVAVHCKTEMSMEQISSVLSLLFKDCKRENVLYKAEAVHSLGLVLEAHKIDKFEHFWEILYPILKMGPADDDSDSDTDKSDTKDKTDPKLKLLENAIEAVGRAWPNVSRTQDECFEKVAKSLVQHISNSSWRIQLATIRTIKILFRAILNSSMDEVMEIDSSDDKGCLRMLNVDESGLLRSICGSLDSTRIMEEALAAIQVVVELFEKKVLKCFMVTEMIEALKTSPMFQKKSIKKETVDSLINTLERLDK